MAALPRSSIRDADQTRAQILPPRYFGSHGFELRLAAGGPALAPQAGSRGMAQLQRVFCFLDAPAQYGRTMRGVPL